MKQVNNNVKRNTAKRISKPDKFKKPQAKSKHERGQQAEIEDTINKMESKVNDAQWYTKYALYAEYAGRLPFGKPIGETFDLNDTTTPTSVSGLKEVIPGVMCLRFVPTIGYSANRNSPINRAAIRWYSKLRQMQKAKGDYDSQDMMMSYMAIDSAAMFHENLRRIVGIGNMSSVLNRYIPEGLLTALGVDPLDVRNNIADWWGYCNKFAIDLENVTMPKDMDLRVRHSWMCSGFYTDGDTERSQIYIFVPEGFWKYNNTVTTGSQLDFVAWPGNPNNLCTLAEVKVVGNAIINALLGDEDIGTISGDTMSAIGVSNCVKYEQISASYTLDGLYSKEVLSQIENSTAVSYWDPSVIPSITQDPSVNQGAILFTPQFSYGSEENALMTLKRSYINFHWERPSVDDVLVATRLHTGAAIPNDSGVVKPTSFGSEIITTFQIIKSKVDSPQTFTTLPGFATNLPLTIGNFASYSQIITALSAFDWHPIIYVFTHTADTDIYIYRGALVDYDVTAVLSKEQLDNLHEAALVSMFDIPDSILAH